MHKSGKEHLYMQCSRCKIFNTNYQFTGAFSVILCLIYMNIEHTVFFFTLLPFFNNGAMLYKKVQYRKHQWNQYYAMTLLLA